MSEAAATPSKWDDIKALSKPRITKMVALTAAAGWYLGHEQTGTSFAWFDFIGNLLGTALCCIGAGMYNQAIEHKTDALMHRTRERPLPASRFSIKFAWLLATLASFVGTSILIALGQPFAAFVAAFTIVLYAAVYTPLKRITTLALLIGAIPGATPPMIGFAGAYESAALNQGFEANIWLQTLETILTHPGFWFPFLIMFVWQIPHFLAIAWLYREDYARAKLAMLPVIDPTGQRTFVQILLGCFILIPISVWPSAVGLSGKLHFVIAIALGLGFLFPAILLVRSHTEKHARLLFFASLIYLPLALASLLFA